MPLILAAAFPFGRMSGMGFGPQIGMLAIAVTLVIAGLSGVCFPDFWAKANSDFNGAFGMSAGPAGKAKFVRLWSGLWLIVGIVLAAIAFTRIIF
jgi:hypothetical protein